MSKDAKIILQIETGLMDGIYFMSYEEVDEIRKRWNARWPQHTHHILNIEDDDFVLPDDKFLPNRGLK